VAHGTDLAGGQFHNTPTTDGIDLKAAVLVSSTDDLSRFHVNFNRSMKHAQPFPDTHSCGGAKYEANLETEFEARPTLSVEGLHEIMHDDHTTIDSH
jgi:hypothetical protein